MACFTVLTGEGRQDQLYILIFFISAKLYKKFNYTNKNRNFSKITIVFVEINIISITYFDNS